MHNRVTMIDAGPLPGSLNLKSSYHYHGYIIQQADGPHPKHCNKAKQISKCVLGNHSKKIGMYIGSKIFIIYYCFFTMKISLFCLKLKKNI